MIDPQDGEFSLRRQCRLLGLNRSNLYYPAAGESEDNLRLMRLLDEQYPRNPYYGVLKILHLLDVDKGRPSPKRGRRVTPPSVGLYERYRYRRTPVDHSLIPRALRPRT